MRKRAGDIGERLEVVTDDDAEPVRAADLDAALAALLLDLIDREEAGRPVPAQGRDG